MNQYIEHYRKEYEARRITRREFAGRLGAAGVAATAATSLLTASDSVLADTPVKGGRMRVGWYTHSASDTLNPNRLTTSLDFMRAYQICSPIVRYSTKITAEPDLATEWNASDDLKTWRFKIRKGVEFHNGKSLTVQDCIYTLNRHRGDKSDSIIKAWLNVITDMRADGDWLVIDLEAPNADFPMYLGDMHAVVVPDGFEDFDNLVGTGPFVLDSFRPGVGMLAKKNPNYHHEGYPHVDEVESFGIGDTAARVNALLAGDIHITVRASSPHRPRMGIGAAAGKEVPRIGRLGAEVAEHELVGEVHVGGDQHARLRRVADAVDEVVEHQRAGLPERRVGGGRLHPDAVVLALDRARVQEPAPGLDDPSGKQGSRHPRGERPGPLAQQERRGQHEQDDRAEHQDLARAELLDQPEPRGERAGDAAQRRERMHRSDDAPRMLAAPQREGREQGCDLNYAQLLTNLQC